MQNFWNAPRNPHSKVTGKSLSGSLTDAISARNTIILQNKTKTEFYAITAKVTQPQDRASTT